MKPPCAPHPLAVQFQHEQRLPEMESRLKAIESGAPWPLARHMHGLLGTCLPGGLLRQCVQIVLIPPTTPTFFCPAEASAISAATEAAAAEFLEARERLRQPQAVVAAAVQQPDHSLHFLRPGRIIRVFEGEGLAALPALRRDASQAHPHVCACVQTHPWFGPACVLPKAET